ncbi:conserved hypothetical protein, partial [Ricinus communis]
VEWLSLKFTPLWRSAYRFGVSVALTESGRRPSHTMMMVRVAAGAAGVVAPAFGVVAAAAVPPSLSLPQAASRMPSASGVIKVVANLTKNLLVGWESTAGW